MTPFSKPLAALLFTVSAALPLLALAQSKPNGMVDIKGLQAGSKKGSTALTIAIPEPAFSATDASLYRSGYERNVVERACAQLPSIRCTIKMVSEDPRTTPLMNLSGGRSGIDAFVWGSEIRMNEKAERAALFDAFEAMAVSSELAQTKKQFMKMDRAWPKPLAVGVENETFTQAKHLCEKIHARCTFVKDSSFTELAKRFDAGQLQWVMHSQSWLFETKDLEDRLTTVMAEEEKAAGGKVSQAADINFLHPEMTNMTNGSGWEPLASIQNTVSKLFDLVPGFHMNDNEWCIPCVLFGRKQGVKAGNA